MDSNLFFIFFFFFNFLQSLGARCSHFPPPSYPPFAQFLKSVFSTPYLSAYLWRNTLSKIQREKNPHYSVINQFISILVSNCEFITITTVVCGKNGNPPPLLVLQEARRCQAPVQQCMEFQLFNFLCILSLLITLCLYMNTDNQHLPTCISLLSPV